MTIIVFLIDTSASMFQRSYIGGRTTILDVAKSAVETFVKIRQRSMDSRVDRYMLLTFEESPNNIKAGWKENLATFMNELKNLQCYSMTTMGVAVKQSFDVLNINRNTSGIDTYGQGRCPFYLETSVIVLITDGGKLTTINGVHEEFNLPMHSPIPGSELTKEPFRWDQRLFALVLRLSGTPAIDRDTGLVPSDNTPIDAMCEVTGGRSYCITSHRMLNQCIDSLVQKVQNGVVLNFEKIGPDPPPPQFDETVTLTEGNGTAAALKDEFEAERNASNTSWHSCRKMIYVPRPSQKSYCVGFWPIPENFWPEVTASVLPPRTAHPNVKFTCTNSEPLVIENLPFDKYELEPSPLTQYILSRKQPKTCWQVFVANSYKNSDVGHPFGYLKASTNLNCVNLFVMPYNYPVLLPLLDELSKIHRWKPTPEWRTQFQNYMRTLPTYYAGPLRRALTRMGTPMALAQSIIPENAEALSYSVNNYLKRVKNLAKTEYDKMCNEITQRLNNIGAIAKNNMSEQIRVPPKVILKKELISHPLLGEKLNNQRDIEQMSTYVCSLHKERQTVSFKNPFDIPRNRLVQQVARMRNNFLQSDWIAHDLDTAHSLPISQMGNYQEYLKRQTPQLREIESAPVRQHMFGNPFKIDKRMMVDEADIDLVGTPSGIRVTKRPNPNQITGVDNGKIPVKRKPGPIPKNFSIRRPSLSLEMSPLSPIQPMIVPTVPLLPSPVPWLSTIEKEIPMFEERPPVLISSVIVENGLDSCSGMSSSGSERSRSPSPTLSIDVPTYGVNDVTPSGRSAPPPQYSTSNSSNSLNMQPQQYSTNNIPDHALYSAPAVPSYDDSQISQILKEVNNISNNHTEENHVENEDENSKDSIEEKEEEDYSAQNYEIRKMLNKLVRRPGKNFTELFDNIKTLKGDLDAQVEILNLVILESLRFKRKYLVGLLEDHIKVLQNVENS